LNALFGQTVVDNALAEITMFGHIKSLSVMVGNVARRSCGPPATISTSSVGGPRYGLPSFSMIGPPATAWTSSIVRTRGSTAASGTTLDCDNVFAADGWDL